MKKIIKTLILVLVVVLALTVFVACNEEPETTTAPVCKHTGGTATCTEAAVCELCGESYGEALGHTGGEATCTEAAVCELCGENYGELKAHELEAFGEDLPTCTEDGLSSGVVCSVCGYQERRRFPIPALGHDMADATCTEPSTCTRKDCGYTEGEALGHDMVEVEALAPTCTAEGYTAHLGCSRCDLTEGKEAVAINPDAHTLVDVAEQAPTCEAVGYTAHKACACGYTEGKEEIAATGHSFTVAVEELAPTTCENGYTAHNECAVCGTPDENYEVLYASHNFTEESYFYYPAPTCTAGGYLAGTCTECGSSFYLEELAPLGHDVEATCTEGGTCSVCGEVVEALGHTWVDADCDTAKTCSVCGATEGEALGHSYVDGVCSSCGYIINVFSGKYFVPTDDAAAQVLSASWWKGGGYNVLTDGQKDQEGVGRFSTLMNNTTAFMDATMILGGAYDLGVMRFYIYDTSDTITEDAKKASIGTGILIQIYADGEWIDVINCADNAALCEYLVINEGLNNDYLEFDLKGVAATRIRFYIPGSASTNGITFQEIECDAVVSKTLESEKEKVLINNIFTGKAFTPTADATASILTASWWKGSGYEGLTDGIKNADNAVGRFSTVMATTGMMDATIDLGGTYELHSLKFYTYDPAAGTGATSLGSDLLIQVYVDGEWKDVVTIADNTTLASYLVVNEGTYNDYLEFDLGGIEAEKVRFYISASASGSGTTYEEIECSGYAK